MNSEKYSTFERFEVKILIWLIFSFINYTFLKIIIMEQGEKYFVAKISSDSVDNETGRVKKLKEEIDIKGKKPLELEQELTD